MSIELLRVVERIVAAVVAADQDLAVQVSALGTARVRLDFTAPEFSVVLTARDGVLSLSEDGDGEPDVVIAGTVHEFVELMRARRAGRPTPSGVVRISGDLAVAEKVQNLVRDFGVDWEALIARLIGDVPTHHTMRAARKASGFIRARMTDVGLDVAEYLKYERGLLVGNDEMAVFTAGVRDARAAVDRLEARVALAEARSGTGE